MLLSLTAFGVGITELIDRETMVSATLLTLIAFKWILSEVVPKVRYLTVLEVYMFVGQIQLIVQGMGFWFVSELFLEYKCVLEEEGEIPFFNKRAKLISEAESG